MLTAEQLAFRRSGITATDAAALSLEHPWRTPFDVYREKVTGDRSVDTFRTRLGHAAEPLLMEALRTERSLYLRDAPTERHPILPWVISSPDREVTMGTATAAIAVAEAKLVGTRVAHHWKDENGQPCVPGYVHAQVQWQMIQRRVKRAYVVAALGDEEPTVFDLVYDDDFAATLLDIGQRFWVDHVQAQKPPTPDGSKAAREMLAAVYPQHKRKKPVAPPSDAPPLVLRYVVASRKIKALQAEKDQAGNLLRAMVGEEKGFENDEFRLLLTTSSRGVPNWKAIAKEAGASPDLVAKHTPPGGRSLRVRVFGGSEEEEG